jgi:hypothetical protein
MDLHSIGATSDGMQVLQNITSLEDWQQENGWTMARTRCGRDSS